MSRTDFSSMDVWQDDRCRDFITLNVIRRLRYYHDTLHHSNEPINDYDNIPISAICQHDRLTENDNIDECNRVRAQNLLLLPRALPDCRPCCAEDQTILQELFLHQKEAEQKREVEFKKLAEKRKLLLEENFSDYHPHSDKNETEDSFLHQHNNNNNNNHQGNNNCAVNLARILFYGKNSFISSLSNRFTVSSHLSESNSNFNHHHQNSNSMEGLAPTPLHYKNKNTTHPDKNSETEIGKEEETVQAVLFDHTPEKQKVDNKEENTTITTTTNTNADTPSPIAPTASDRNNNNNEEEDNGNSCEVCTVLIQHFQNMLQRGIVLDRYSSKDLLFCWWVLGKEMDLRFIYENSNLTNNNNNSDEVVTKLSIKRESLLILLRDFYYSLLSKYYGNNNNNNNNEQSGAPHATTAEGTAAHSHQDENHQNNTNSNTTRHRNDRSKRQSAPADNEIVKRSARLERNRMEKLEKEEMNAPLVPLTGEAAKAAPEKERRGRKRKREEEKAESKEDNNNKNNSGAVPSSGTEKPSSRKTKKEEKEKDEPVREETPEKTTSPKKETRQRRRKEKEKEDPPPSIETEQNTVDTKKRRNRKETTLTKETTTTEAPVETEVPKTGNKRNRKQMAKTEEEEETGSKVEKDTKIKTETKKETTKEEPDTNQNNPDEHKDSHTTEVYSPLLSHLHPTNIFKTEFQKRIENRITERLSHHHNKKEHEMYSFLFNNALHYEDSTIIKRRFYTDKIAKQNEPQKEETALDEDNPNHHHHQSRKRRGRKSVSVGDVDPILFAFHHNFSAHYQNNHNHNNTNLDSFHNRFTVEDNRKYAEKVKSHLEQNESETNHIENLELDNMDICQKPFSQLTYPQQCLLTWEVQSLLHQQETIQKRVERRLISKKEREAALNRKPARMLTRRFLQEMKEKQQSEQEMHGEEELFTAAVTDATPLPGGTKQVVVDMLAEDLTEVLASDEEEEEESLSPQDDDHHNKDHTEENAPSGDTKKDFRCYYDYWKKERAFLSPVQEEK